MPTLYISEAVAVVTTDDGDFGPQIAAMPVYDTYTGGSPLTDIQDLDANPLSQVTPDTDAGYQCVFQSTGHSGTLFLQDSNGVRHPVQPADLGNRVGGVSKVTFGGIDHTGNVTIPDVDWATVSAADDFPTVIAAGATQEAARAEIDAASPDDIPDGFPTTTGADPGDILTVNSDGTSSYQPQQLPDDVLRGFTKPSGAATPGGTVAGRLVFEKAASGTTWGYDTSLGGGNATGSGSRSADITLTQPVAAGRYIIIAVGADAAGGTASTWSAADNHAGTTNVYNAPTSSPALRQVQGTTNQSQLIWCKVTTALAIGDKITVTSDIDRSQITVTASTIVGAVASSALDKSTTGGNAGSTSLAIGPTGPTTQVDEIGFGVFVYQGSGHSNTPPAVQGFTPSNGWVIAGTKNSTTGTPMRTVVLVYKLFTTTATVSPTGEMDSSVNYSGVVATFKKA